MWLTLYLHRKRKHFSPLFPLPFPFPLPTRPTKCNRGANLRLQDRTRDCFTGVWVWVRSNFSDLPRPSTSGIRNRLQMGQVSIRGA